RLETRLARKASTLATGERRRPEIAVAVMRRPDCLLADEPLLGIAPADAELVSQSLRDLAGRGTAVVVSGHEVPRLLELADELVWQTAGTTHFLGTPQEARKRLGLQADCFVRTAEEWKAIVAHNPFPKEAERDPGHLLVMFLKDAPARNDVEALQAAITGPEVVRATGRHAYIVYPNGIGRSRLTNALIERKLGTPGTGRNWNTVLKLRALAEP